MTSTVPQYMRQSLPSRQPQTPSWSFPFNKTHYNPQDEIAVAPVTPEPYSPCIGIRTAAAASGSMNAFMGVETYAALFSEPAASIMSLEILLALS